MSLATGYITLTPVDPYGQPDAAMSALLNGDADVLYMVRFTLGNRRRWCV